MRTTVSLTQLFFNRQGLLAKIIKICLLTKSFAESEQGVLYYWKWDAKRMFMGLQIFTSFSSFRFIIFCLNISLVLAEKHGLFWEKCEKFPNSNAVDIVGKCCGKLFYNRFSICIDYFSPVPRKLSFFRQKARNSHWKKSTKFTLFSSSADQGGSTSTSFFTKRRRWSSCASKACRGSLVCTQIGMKHSS